FEDISRQLFDKDENLQQTLKQLQEQYIELEKAKADLANHQKSGFFASMSHELRTPITGIIGITELLLDAELTDYQRNYLDKIMLSAANLLELINGVLDFSRIEAGKFALDPTPFTLKKIAQEVVDLVSIKALEKNLDISLNYHQNIPEFLIGDALRIKQILYNLIGNAIKFTDNGHIYTNLEKISHSDDGIVQVKISVEDTGIGLTEEQQKIIFKAFTQADSSTTRKYGGTGLGLAICKELANLMEGTIGVESEFGKGATFWVIISLQVDKKLDSRPKLVSSLNPYKPVQKEKVSDKKILVLIVEDNMINREFTTEMLHKIGCEVVTANNGKEGVEAVEKNKNIDLIFMDCLMPVMDGFEATRQIHLMKLEKKIPFIPIIALTASVTRSDRDKCIEAGMDDFLSNPIHQNELKDMIEKWVT
ncbi:MAG: response regulator, partial [Rickettsiaceae bacterium]|nr:response regulator [Rickettsiaceae bacterium]